MLYFSEIQDDHGYEDKQNVNIGVFDTVRGSQNATVAAMWQYAHDHMVRNFTGYVWALRLNQPIQSYTRLVTYFSMENGKIIQYNVVTVQREDGSKSTKIDYDHPAHIWE